MSFDAKSVQATMTARQAQLNALKPHLSGALYQTIANKLAAEATAAASLLASEQATKERLSHYSFVLDQQYFEQKFLS